uniref:MFS domain-containing protein n=1 Tax=Haemonchus contortus TaxID=6289 RepID=A0A7I4Y7J8_HAECO
MTDVIHTENLENSNSAPIATISKSGKIEHSKTPWPSIYIAGICAFIQAAQFSIFFSSMWPYLRKLNPQIVETEYGYIVAMYSLGQCISAPTFGYWSNRIEQVRIPLLTGFVMMMIGNSIYFSLQFFDPSIVAIVMMIARFTTGSGTGNMALLRAYASTSSLKTDRSRAIACVSGGVATGTLIGPAFQLLFTPLGSDGIYILPFYQLNIYNAPALFALLLNILGFMLIMYAFEESYDVLHSEAAKETAGLPSPCMIAVLVCVITRFVQVFSATTIETLGSPFSMLMFSFNKEEAVAANSAAHLAAGVVGVILYVVFIFFDLSKWVPPRISTICSISIYGGLFLFTLPWPFLPGHVEPAANGSDFGCYTERFTWCNGLTGVSKWVYYPFYVSVFGVAASILNIAVTTLYSEIIGPRRQGTFQGVFQMASSNGRLFAPLITSMLYTKYGPVAPWSLDIILVCIIVVLWTLFRRKMVPLKTRACANACSP